MKKFYQSVLLLSILTCAQTTLAREPYYALSRSTRHGSEVLRTVAAATFTWQKNEQSTGETKTFVCSVQNLLPYNRGSGFFFTVTHAIAESTHQDSKQLRIALVATDCRPPPIPEPARKPLKTMYIDLNGRVLSKNPVWNACTQGYPISADFMKTNEDFILIRQGSTRTHRRLSCRDYHKGNLRVWKFADDRDVELYLDARGRLLGDAPRGYVLKTVK